MMQIFPAGMKRLRLVLWSAVFLAALVAGLALWMAPRMSAVAFVAIMPMLYAMFI